MYALIILPQIYNISGMHWSRRDNDRYVNLTVN